MRWAHDACGNADLGEVAFAGRGVSAILEHVKTKVDFRRNEKHGL
jgi:hypothetical protein